MINPSEHAHVNGLLERAFESAHRGDVESALALVAQVRAIQPVESDLTLAVRVLLTEGIIFAYQCEWDKATDRFRRSKIFCGSVVDSENAALIHAWQAYVDFNADALDEAAKNAILALNCPQASRRAVCRASLVLAALLQHAGSDKAGQAWADFAKRVAERLGDTAQTSVLIFNAIAGRVSAERIDRLLGSSGKRDLALELRFAQSALNFDRAAGIELIPDLHNLVQAQILNLREAFDLAREVLSPIVRDLKNHENKLAPHFLIEWYWSRQLTKDPLLSVEELYKFEERIEEFHNEDDRAVVFFRLSHLFEMLNDKNKATLYQDKYRDAVGKFLAWRSRFVNEFSNEISSISWRLSNDF